MQKRRGWIWFAVLVGLFSAATLLPVTWAAPDQNSLRQSVPTLTPIGWMPTLPPVTVELPTVVIPTVEVPGVTLTLPRFTLTVPPVLATATPRPAATGTPAPATSTPMPASSTPTATPTVTPAPTDTPSPQPPATEEPAVVLTPTVTATVVAAEGQAAGSGMTPFLIGGGVLMILGVALFIVARRRRGSAAG